MNIGFIYGTRTFPPRRAGSIHGYQLSRALAARGHRLFNWYYGDDNNPVVHHFRARQLLRFLRHIDVLYVRVSWTSNTCRFSLLRRAWPWRPPVVWELNGLPEELVYSGEAGSAVPVANRRLRRFARHADAAIGVTPRIRDYLREELGIPKAYYVPSGADTDMFKPADRTPGDARPLRAVWMGNTEANWHDLDTILQAARRVHEQKAGIKFHIYGTKAHLPAAMPPNVRCHGRIPYLELGRHIGSADVGIAFFKALDDGTMKDVLPLKLFDYMASGLAVLAQDTGVMGDIIRERQAGLLVTDSADDLAATLMRLEKDRGLCRTLGQNARKAAVDYYNWDRVAAETEAVLLEALGR